jgi:hypothetical protein
MLNIKNLIILNNEEKNKNSDKYDGLIKPSL